jgi:hypothetical protein
VIATPPVALAASPSRLVVVAGETRAVALSNVGAAPITVDGAAFRFGLSLRGRPRILLPTVTVRLAPARFTLAPGTTRLVNVSPRGRLEPGDAPAVVLFSARGARTGLAVQLRVGVVVLLRGTGVVIHRLVVTGVRRARDALEVVFRNDGNVSERIGGRELLPHTRGIVVLHGRGTVVVRGAGKVWRFRVRR